MRNTPTAGRSPMPPRPEPIVALSIRLPASVHRELCERAQDNQRSMAAQATMEISQALKASKASPARLRPSWRERRGR